MSPQAPRYPPGHPQYDGPPQGRPIPPPAPPDKRGETIIVRHVEQPELLICSAIQMPDGYIVRGHRHDDCIIAAANMRKQGNYKQQRYLKDALHAATQGFMTSRGVFVDRADAAVIFRASGGKFQGAVLTSEDLW